MPYTGMLQSIETAAPLFNVAITTRGVADAAELELAIAAAGRETGLRLSCCPTYSTRPIMSRSSRSRRSTTCPQSMHSVISLLAAADVLWHQRGGGIPTSGVVRRSHPQAPIPRSSNPGTEQI